MAVMLAMMEKQDAARREDAARQDAARREDAARHEAMVLRMMDAQRQQQERTDAQMAFTNQLLMALLNQPGSSSAPSPLSLAAKSPWISPDPHYTTAALMQPQEGAPYAPGGVPQHPQAPQSLPATPAPVSPSIPSSAINYVYNNNTAVGPGAGASVTTPAAPLAAAPPTQQPAHGLLPATPDYRTPFPAPIGYPQ